jgi:SulP family sulfate permease
MVADVFLQPVGLFRGYKLSSLRPDLMAGLTVAVILLPQSIAYALIAELPLQMGLYAAIIAAIVGALWGSSNHLQTGPTNATSLLVLSTLVAIAAPGTAEYVLLAGLIAVEAGVIRLAMGLARLGVRSPTETRCGFLGRRPIRLCHASGTRGRNTAGHP